MATQNNIESASDQRCYLLTAEEAGTAFEAIAQSAVVSRCECDDGVGRRFCSNRNEYHQRGSSEKDVARFICKN